MDYALTRKEVDGDQLVLIGMSLGGFMAARAATFEHRFRAAVLFDGLYDYHQVILSMLPQDTLAAWKAGDTERFKDLLGQQMPNDTTLRWTMTQGAWSFRVPTFAAFVEATKPWTMEGIADKIQSPCLVMDAQEDMFSKGQPQQIYAALRAPKQLAEFSSEDAPKTIVSPARWR